MKFTLSVLVENEAGVLTRITSLFARRGFNIESLAVGPSEEPGLSRITFIIPSSLETPEQIIKQLYKLINVLKVEDYTTKPCVERELLLIKVKADSHEVRAQILNIATIFRVRIVDFGKHTFILEIVGDPGKVLVIERILESFGIVEIARTGRVCLTRGSGINTELLKTLPPRSLTS